LSGWGGVGWDMSWSPNFEVRPLTLNDVFYADVLRPLEVKVHTLNDIAPLRSESPPQKCSGMACVLKGFHSFTCKPPWRSSTIGMSHTCCHPFPAAAGTHLPTLEGWKAE